MPACPSCQTEVSEDANYCPNCGDPIEEGATLPVEQNSDTKIKIQFGFSRSKYYEEAVALCDNVDTYRKSGEGSDAKHEVVLTHDDLQLISYGTWSADGNHRSCSLTERL